MGNALPVRRGPALGLNELNRTERVHLAGQPVDDEQTFTDHHLLQANQRVDRPVLWGVRGILQDH